MIVHLTNPVSKTMYGTLLAVVGFLLIVQQNKPLTGLVVMGVAALVVWNAARQWKAAAGRRVLR
jgi:hypothetical protein